MICGEGEGGWNNLMKLLPAYLLGTKHGSDLEQCECLYPLSQLLFLLEFRLVA